MITTAAHNNHRVWFSDHLHLSYRDGQALLVKRVIDVTYEAIYQL